MTLLVADRVLETCAAPGTGTVTLLGAEVGYQAFSAAIGNGNTTYYTIADQSGSNWEVGIGTYSLGANTLARTTVLASSNSGSLTNFNAGVQNVFVTYPAEKSVNYDASGNLTLTGTTNIANLNVSTTMTLNGAAGTSGQVLTSAGSGSLPTWQTPSSSVTTATNLAGGAAGSVPYQSAAGATTFLGIGTANYVMTSSGTAPQWSNSLSLGGALTAAADSSFTSTGALLISKGTSGQQPGSPVTGMMRYNTTTNQFEGYSGSSPAWKSIGGSALSNDTTTATAVYPVFASATTGTAENLYTSNANLLYTPSTGALQAVTVGASNGIFTNANTIAASQTIAATDNAGSFGPVTVNSGVTVTVSSGAVWTVV